MKQNYHAIIVGAGVIGAALALLLARSSSARRFLVLERTAKTPKDTTPNQRVFALGAAAQNVLAELQIWQQLTSQQCYPYTGMYVWDQASAGELSFSANQLGLSDLGHMVDAIALQYHLQQQLLATDNIEVLFECQPESLNFTETGVSIVSANGESRAPLLIAADGGKSWARQQAGIYAERYHYQQLGIVARIGLQHSHHSTAWQRFTDHGIIALLPLENGDCSLVWSLDKTRAQTLLALSEQDFARRLSSLLDNRFGRLQLNSPRTHFPLQSLRTRQYYRPGLVLAGDAAHTIHPLAGQGANLGFKDIAALARILHQQQVDDWGKVTVLHRYQQSRQIDNRQTDTLMSALNSVFAIDAPFWQWVRGQGMRTLNDLEFVKRLLVSYAA